MLERDVDGKIVNYAKTKYDALVLKLTMLGRYGIAGLPDRLFLGKNRVVFFIEMKKPGGKMSKIQEYMCGLLASFGFNVYCVDDVEVGKAIVDKEFGNGTSDAA